MPVPLATMLPLVLTVRLPLVAVAVFCSLMAWIPCTSPDPLTLMLPVLLDVAATPCTPETFPLTMIVVLPLPPVTIELMPFPPPVAVTSAPGMVVTATLPPLLLMSTALPPTVFAIGFGPVAETTFRSTLKPPAPPEMVTPPVVTVSLLNWTSRLPVAVLVTEASVPEQTETPAVLASHTAQAGRTPANKTIWMDISAAPASRMRLRRSRTRVRDRADHAPSPAALPVAAAARNRSRISRPNRGTKPPAVNGRNVTATLAVKCPRSNDRRSIKAALIRQLRPPIG